MKDRPFKCQLCKHKGFRFKTALDQHLYDKHRVGEPLAKKKAEAQPPKCIDCGGTAAEVGGEVIYPHRSDLYHKRFWLCQCGAYCGCHPGSNQPLGYPCNAATRKARSAAHAAFDPIWQNNIMTRASAYGWLADQLGIEKIDCHIGMMDRETAWKTAEIAREFRNRKDAA